MSTHRRDASGALTAPWFRAFVLVRCVYCNRRLRPEDTHHVDDGVVLCAADARRLLGPHV
jgi:hypothetical protein